MTRDIVSYTMPPAYVGLMVNYFHRKGDSPLPAIVSGLGTRTLKLSVLEPEHAGMTFFDGVRHATDPDDRAIASSGYGVWDYCPDQEAIAQRPLREDMQDLKIYFDSAMKAYRQAHEEAKTAIAALENRIKELEVQRLEAGPPARKKKGPNLRSLEVAA